MKVVYINLDKDTERRAFMEEQLSSLGFEYERVIAIDGRKLSDSEIEKVYDSALSVKYNKKDLTRGEIGCSLSHKICHEIALEHDYTLVLEDDVMLPDNFKEIVERQIEINNQKRHWEYLQFDYPSTGIIFIKRWFGSVKLYMDTHLKEVSIYTKVKYLSYLLIKLSYITLSSALEGFRDYIHRLLNKTSTVTFYRPLYFAGCYLLTKEGAQKLLKLENKIFFAADRIHNQARIKLDLKIKVFCPLIVMQNRVKLGSSILGVKSIDY